MSCACVKSELDLFTVPLKQESVASGTWTELKAVAALNNSYVIEFHSSGSGDDYVDPANMYLHLQARVVKKDGNNLEAAAPVGPVNNWMNALFKEVILDLNGTIISHFNYAYKSDVELKTSFGEGAKNTQLESVLYEKDDHDLNNLTTNTGFVKRQKYTKDSQVVDMCGKLHLDITNQDKFLPNGVDMNLKLIRNSDEFVLMSSAPDAYKVEIVDASLFVRKTKLFPEVQAAHIKAFERGPARYPIQRGEVKTFTLASGARSFSQENVYNGQLPKRLIVAMVDNSAFNGDVAENPFNYKNQKLNRMAIYVDGTQVPSKPLTPDFENNRIARAFVNLSQATGKYFQDEDNGITREDFGNGYALFAFDLTPDLSGDSEVHSHLTRGNLRIELGFAEDLAKTVTLVVYGQFSNTLLIDRNRNVITDFH
jgi:uncharacterized protein (DUF2132 family)